MKILFFDKKQGTTKILVETLEDLWHLENILEPGDRISSSTMRTVKFGDKEEKKPVFVTIELEGIDFSKSVNRLRLKGKILSGNPEDFVQIGRYHTIDAEKNSKISIQKKWKNFQIKRLKEAEKEGKKPLIRIVVLDDEKAVTAVLRGYGIEYGPEIRNHGSKKSEDYEKQTNEYYGQILKYLEKFEERILIAGPGFTKDNLKKFINQKEAEISKRIILDSCSYAERTGVNELLKRGVLERVAGEQRMEKEEKAIEEFAIELNKSGMVAYGSDEVETALNNGAIKKLLVLDELLRKDKKVQNIVENAEKLKAELLIFSKDGDPGIKLKGFSGIAAILRFKI